MALVGTTVKGVAEAFLSGDRLRPVCATPTARPCGATWQNR